MKTLLPLLLSSFLLAGNCGAQNPLVKQWDYRFGGTDGDALTCFQQTKDGGYILGGSSHSGISGDKTQATWGSADYWIVKTDSLGNKEWDKDFGGTDYDYLYSIDQTSDGGYILGGYSGSGISGNKTQLSWGGDDFWIVKTDSLGNIQWDKDFGGTGTDYIQSIQQTADGGYILGGRSSSGIGGNKTQATQGGFDYWIVKTDSLGIKQWDKDFGGTQDEYIFSLEQTSDAGYILGGYSYSGISGDKTQANWGGWDYWIVKTDSLGIKQWDKDFGGTNDDQLQSIQQTADSGYNLSGYSASGISGDKTQAMWGVYDYWIVKTNSLGIKQWDKDFGGTGYDVLYKVSQTTDGGYLISGDSYSPVSGDKTESNLGAKQTWVVKTDSSGNKQWDKTIFTDGDAARGLAIQMSDGCYAIANNTAGGIAGYKTQPAWNNSSDYWLIKFCDTTLTTNLPPSQLNNPNSGINIFPNPTEGKFAVRLTPALSEGEGVVTIFNILGEKVYSQQQTSTSSVNGRWLSLSKPETLIDISSCPSGIYILQLTDGEKIFRAKVVKE